MKAPTYRLTPAADRDVEGILRQSEQLFGSAQQGRYARLIEAAAELVAAHPTRPGSRAPDDLGRGIRAFHVELAASRRGAASHVLYYVSTADAGANESVAILRVLHEAMDPRRHLTGDPG